MRFNNGGQRIGTGAQPGTTRRVRVAGAIATAALLSAAIVVGGGRPDVSAGAWPSPTITTPATVTADVLPTVQINGVVWAQVVVGNTVYVGGSFTAARPAGQPAGTNEVPRSNFLAFDLDTGELLSSVVLDANAQVRTVEASPDGSRVYVAGDFTSFGGQPRNRLAAIDTATNALVPDFAPNVGYHVYDLGVTDTTVYAAGNFTSVGVNVRERVAAFNTNGQLLSWAPSVPDRAVWAIRVAPDGTKVAIAGAFETVNGSNSFGRGLAMLDAVTGATLPFAAATAIRNGGRDGAITSLESDGELLFGGGYNSGLDGGTLEGTFAADWDGNLRWVADCHGDTYSVYPVGDVVYTASHTHYCGNVDGFGQPDTWEFYRGMAFSRAVAGTVMTERLGYPNFAGQPRPDVLNFFPAINAGTFTGATQGPWSVTANSRYVVFGGEFTRVNGAAQQGLVRFQRRESATNKQGPMLFNATYPVKVRSFTAGTVTLTWQANRDRDDATLKYTVYRRAAGTTVNGTIRHTRTVTAPFWNRHVMTWTDSGDDVVPGTTYEYRVQVTDGYNNFANSTWAPFTIPASGAASDYLTAVLHSEPDSFWRLGEAAGSSVAADLVGWRAATYPAGTTFSQAGAINSDIDTAVRLNGNTGTFIRTSSYESPPQVFTLEAWFRTPSNGDGGLIVGFNNSNTANSGAGSTSANDRAIYMDYNGRLHFAVNPTGYETVTSERNYRDDQWHHATGTLGDDGARLYIDGVLIGERTDVTYARTGYYGYWRIGGGALDNFPDTNQTTSRWFDGSIDDVALYKKVLTPDQISTHFTASGRAPAVPDDAYGAAVHGSLASFYWRLGEQSGTTAFDTSPEARNGTYLGTVTLGTGGAVADTTDTAAGFNGTNSRVTTTVSVPAPQTFSQALWFKTTTTSGGKLIGFGDSSTTSNSTNYDRHIYLQNNGTLVFGTNRAGTPTARQFSPTYQNRITTAAAYNDGQWHHVVATQSSNGMRLYVDGVEVGSHPATTARTYGGFWRVGGDPTWGSSSGYFDGTIDEVAVYPYALEATAVFDHYVLGSGVTPNLAPTAEFSSTVDVDGLTASFDAAASSDADGSIVGYAWNFGDGSPAAEGIEPSTTHTFATAGTFTVALTVTDDDGATHHTTDNVTTIGANQLPEPAVNFHVSGRDVSASAAASSDADGSIVDYAWNFGDGTAVVHTTAATVTHTYAAAGTYAIGLTVTDDRGGTRQIVSQISTNQLPTVAPAPGATLASDTFERTTTDSLGTADLGGAWTQSGSAANYSVDGGRGNIRMGSAGAGPIATLSGVSSVDSDAVVDMTVDKAATGGGTYLSLIGRRIAGTGDYRTIIRYQSNGLLQALLVRNTGGADTVLASVARVPGVAAVAGQVVRVRLQVTGTNPTLVRVKVWAAGTAEPAAWLLTTSDAAASHQVPGAVAVMVYLSGSATNAPVIANFDNLSVINPVAGLNATPTAAFSTTVDELGAEFDASLTVDDGSIVGWSWDFGDGQTSTVGPTETHAYATAGTYPVTLTVVDDLGATNQVTFDVSVN